MRTIKFEGIDMSGNIIRNIGKIEFFVDGQIIVNDEYPVKELREYTGRLDKNGKEIYFDDLVQAPSGEIFQVIWYDEELRIALKQKDTIYNFNVPLYEVIGNIYENPELLK